MGASTTLDEVNGWSLQRPGFRVFCETPFQVDERTCLVPNVSVIFSSGPSVWAVYSEQRSVSVYDAVGRSKRFYDDQPLVDPAVLPGFSTPTSAIFEGV
jgi:hypothetical protein